jgi:hypothetical protein
LYAEATTSSSLILLDSYINFVILVAMVSNIVTTSSWSKAEPPTFLEPIYS